MVAGNVLNEFFLRGPLAGAENEAVQVLKDWRSIFPPGCLLMNVDYCGYLGTETPTSSDKLRSLSSTLLVHDIAQVSSGQGVPPPSGAAWKEIYEAAGCELVDGVSFTRSRNSMRSFIHIVRM